jgi:hypothetical protein
MDVETPVVVNLSAVQRDFMVGKTFALEKLSSSISLEQISVVAINSNELLLF